MQLASCSTYSAKLPFVAVVVVNLTHMEECEEQREEVYTQDEFLLFLKVVCKGRGGECFQELTVSVN